MQVTGQQRIRELAEEAGMRFNKHGMAWANKDHLRYGVDLEKFTESIVKECALVAWMYEPSSESADMIAQAIYNNFGLGVK